MASRTEPDPTPVDAVGGLVRDLGGLGVGIEAAEALAADLVGRWSEPHRHYHDITHLLEVLGALDELGLPEGSDAVVARLTAWFHDAVYDARGTRGDSGEAASAALAADRLTAVGVASGPVERVRDLVLATATHEMGSDPAAAGFLDADLWILAAETPRFDAYCDAVRREYAHVADDRYAAGRAAVLGPFLTRESIYLTRHARETWEPAARANLRRELDRLSAGL